MTAVQVDETLLELIKNIEVNSPGNTNYLNNACNFCFRFGHYQIHLRIDIFFFINHLECLSFFIRCQKFFTVGTETCYFALKYL